VFASSGVSLEDCIVEGANPVRAIYFDSAGATVAKHFRVTNLHSELSPTDCVIKIAAAWSGQFELESIWHQTGSVLIDGSGSSSEARVFVRNLVMFPGGASFKTDPVGPKWQFDNPPAALDPSNAANWMGGVRPNDMYFWQTRTGGVFIHPTDMFTLDGHVTISGPFQFTTGTGAIALKGATLGFYGMAPSAKPTVTGSKGGNAALASLIAALANLGLITDSSTA
jgi:hypothetical protein